ncbi:MAG: hypothetical protein R8K48_01155 [Gallionella sp.]
MTISSSLSVIFIAEGLTLLAGVAYLAHWVGRHRRLLDALLKLAIKNRDPLRLPASAWPTLASGGIKRLHFSGTWFGQAVQGNFGAAQVHSQPFTFKVIANSDISIDFQLYAQENRGEARLFAENLTGVFRLLLETAVHSKMDALSAALAEQAKLTLYMQHDLRNLSQWVQWLAADFHDAKNDADLLTVAQRLQLGAPHAAARAKRILDATCKSRTQAQLQTVSLADVIREAAEHAGINITITQDAHALLHRELLDRTLDNLFANVAPLLRQHPDSIITATINKTETKIQIPRFTHLVQRPAERLFEPFASGRPGGLGLGLYQAQKSIQQAGGDLTAELGENDIFFLLSLPNIATDKMQV